MSSRAGSRASRRVQHAYSLGPFLRVADRCAGRFDRNAPEGPGGTEYELRLSATAWENDQRIFTDTADRLSPAARELSNTYGQWKRLGYEIAQAEARVAAVPEPVLSPVGHGERHLDAAAIAARRGREHAAVVAGLVAHADQLRAERGAAHKRCVSLLADITDAFELARERSERLRWYYTRRRATYNRARHRKSSARNIETAAQAWQLPPAAWSSKPCPWIPAGIENDIPGKEENARVR